MANPNPGLRPDWVNDKLFPFKSNFVEIDGNVVHYVDEGSGPTLLFYHGNPSWSFLNRDLIAGLEHRFRCVALDLPGFGLSSSSPGYTFTAAEHRDVAAAFVEALDLRDLTPMVQDWGGPIGLGAALRDPERYRALIIGNTWGWPGHDLNTKVFSKVLGGPIGGFLIGRFNFFAKRIVPFGHARRHLTDAELAHYTSPFPDEASRIPTHVFPREILTAAPLLEEVNQGLATFADRPVLIVWGNKDQAFRKEALERWQSTYPEATTHILDGAGHYIQDDAGDEIVETIEAWWGESVEV